MCHSSAPIAGAQPQSGARGLVELTRFRDDLVSGEGFRPLGSGLVVQGFGWGGAQPGEAHMPSGEAGVCEGIGVRFEGLGWERAWVTSCSLPAFDTTRFLVLGFRTEGRGREGKLDARWRLRHSLHLNSRCLLPLRRCLASAGV